MLQSSWPTLWQPWTWRGLNLGQSTLLDSVVRAGCWPGEVGTVCVRNLNQSKPTIELPSQLQLLHGFVAPAPPGAHHSPSTAWPTCPLFYRPYKNKIQDKIGFFCVRWWVLSLISKSEVAKCQRSLLWLQGRTTLPWEVLHIYIIKQLNVLDFRHKISQENYDPSFDPIALT